LVDRLLDSLVRFTVALRQYFLQRFLLLGWIGRVVVIAITLYGTGWILGTLGWDGVAREVGSAAIFIATLLATFLVIRWVWRNYAGRRF
jgi:hypothetical protein